jgi:hypothetical protein
MEVKSCKSSATLVLRQECNVRLRPDLAVQPFSVPDSYVGSIVNIAVPVHELNGDLDASANVYLYEGDNLLDLVEGAWISALGSAHAVFSVVFDTAGVHQLKVIVADVVPGDYEYANNELVFEVEISHQPSTYDAYYSHTAYEYHRERTLPWNLTVVEGRTRRLDDETFSESLYPPSGLRFPVERVTLQIDADGTPRYNFELTGVGSGYDNGCYHYGSASVTLANNFILHLYSRYYDSSCGPSYYTYARVNKYYRDWYESYNYVYSWGPSSGETATHYGVEPLNASSSINIRLLIEDDGATFGGSVSVPLSSSPINESWNVVSPESGAFDRGYRRGTQTSGSSYGVVTP